MNNQLITRAKRIISKILYITVATSNKQGVPWNSPVYSAFDDKYNFYWISWIKNQHSRNIKENNQIFIVIFDSTAVEGQGHGVYIQAKAYELDDDKEIAHALKYLDGRINKLGRHKTSQFQGSKPSRIYVRNLSFWTNPKLAHRLPKPKVLPACTAARPNKTKA